VHSDTSKTEKSVKVSESVKDDQQNQALDISDIKVNELDKEGGQTETEQ